jgi:CHAT domain-containing protein/tetratricopeptide (TPR) repeat protein
MLAALAQLNAAFETALANALDRGSIEENPELRAMLDQRPLQQALDSWVLIEDPEASRAYLQSHPELLCDECEQMLSTDLASARWTGDADISEAYERCSRLLATSRKEGVDSAYALQASGPLPQDAGKRTPIQVALMQWVQLDDAGASMNYLEAHPELLTDEGQQALAGLIPLVAFEEVFGGPSDNLGDTTRALQAFVALLTAARSEGIAEAYAKRYGVAVALSAANVPLQLRKDLAQLGPLTRPEDASKLVTTLEAALANISESDYPQVYYALQVQLGLALTENLIGARQEQLRRAIEYFNRVLDRAPREAMTEVWAAAQTNKGVALRRLSEMLTGEERAQALTDSLDCFEVLLAMYSREANPAEWAQAQANKSATLAHLAKAADGDERAHLLRQSLASCDAALSVWTRDAAPDSWARARGNQGAALRELAESLGGEERAKSLRAAVAAFDDVLLVFTPDTNTVLWAQTQFNRGDALLTLAEVLAGEDRIKCLRDAIASHDAALQWQSRDVSPAEWARTQNYKGVALRELAGTLPTEERAQFLQESIACFDVALLEGRREVTPGLWATTLGSKANALLDIAYLLTREQATEAVHDAIACYDAALEVVQRDELPFLWAANQVNKGNALRRLAELQIGADVTGAIQRLQDSVTCFDAALSVFTRTGAPTRWALTMSNKGEALHSWVDLANLLDRAKAQAGEAGRLAVDLKPLSEVMLREAINCIDGAQEELGRDMAPAQWAQLQHRKGRMLTTLFGMVTGDEQAEALRGAVACYDAALQEYHLSLFPVEHRIVAQAAGDLLFTTGDWAGAARYLATALDAVDALFSLSITAYGRQTGLVAGGDLTARLAYALIRSEEQDVALDAAAALERGRARATGEAVLRQEEQLRVARRLDPALMATFRVAADQLAASTLGTLSEDINIRPSAQEVDAPGNDRIAALTAQFGDYEQATKARAAYDAALTQIRERIPDFLAVSDSVSAAGAALAPAERLSYLASTDAGTTVVTILPSTDLGAAQAAAWWDEQLTTPVVAHLLYATTPSARENDPASGLLSAQQGGKQDLSAALQRVANTLGHPETALAHLAADCREAGVSRLVLVPCGLFGLLPLHAALVPGPTPEDAYAPFQDGVRISYVPSAQIWLTARQRAHATPAMPVSNALVIGNPLPLPEGWKPLAGAEEEARQVSALLSAGSRGQVQTLTRESATRAAVLTALGEEESLLSHVHFACHGAADPDDPERSALILAHGARLMVRDLLNPTEGIRFEHLRLATLSACQTGVPGVELPDEVVGLPTGWLQAGAAGVLASLWPVSDAATVALMTRFYELHLLDGLDPVDALWLAQRWLRGLPSWREDYAAAGATRALAEPEATDVVRGLAQTRGLGLVEEGDEDAERDAPSGASEGVMRRANWQHPRVWAAFAVYGA